MKTFNNERGFTVVELVLSFAFVMFLAVAMFALVNTYRSKEQQESVTRDLLTLKTTLTQDIYEDILKYKLDKIEYCKDENGEIIKQCINIYYVNIVEAKQLKIETNKVPIEEEGTIFNIDAFTIVYDNVKYKNPDPKFTEVVNDYILSYTTVEDNLEYGVLYKIKIRLRHQDINDEFVIELVSTGIN